MGYETKLFVVKEFGQLPIDDAPSGQILCMIDLAKCDYNGSLHKLFSSTPKGDEPPTFTLTGMEPDCQHRVVEFLEEIAETTTAYTEFAAEARELASELENNQITEDKYGNRLGVFNIDHVIELLEKELERDDYRRFRWALMMLKAIKEDCPEYKLKVVTYGH